MKAFHEARDTFALIHAYKKCGIPEDEWFTEESAAKMRNTFAYHHAMLAFQWFHLRAKLKELIPWPLNKLF